MTEHLWPESILDHRSSGLLELVWQDHMRALIPHPLLRSLCRCAGCEQQFRLSGRRAEVSPDIRLEDIRPVGDKALNLVFSDGHGRGIYPWAYLRELSRAHSVAREALVSAP
ncbi:DUF971 domain-containing protein [Piscinibacter sp. XHJ-5]|uniref:DUF971 domain-containing protein n=1 Tax=Piscinibacter sp. XHJ-5 TaxID=3037797 RepID=UPI00245352BE|nr:DUF971 domain-containing protein [Piscinibacter sp. XHJ-5]